jgi:predicted aldo/keto reductase-like oxidoreductase
LRTDYFDLYQLHGIVSVEKDVDAVFVKGGVMDMLLARKQAGQIRFLGFSAHTVEAAFAAMERYDFDSVLFPFNFATWDKAGFGPQVMKRAQEKGVARLALKAMARQQWAEGDPKHEQFSKCWYEPLSEPEWVALALRWTLSKPVTAAIPPGEEPLFRMALDIAMDFTPVTEAEEARLKEYAASLRPIFTLS